VRRGYDPRFLWRLPNSRISVMGGEQAANVRPRCAACHRRQGRTWPEAEEEAFKAPIRAQYEKQAIPITPRRDCGTDGIIDPIDNPRVLRPCPVRSP